ncbi:MAG: DUF3817 domain-containing protein [Geodermatophilaceae bacterium]|nr:DUF3817 domain-containing protein [Geodermatophilaceae bacterium]
MQTSAGADPRMAARTTAALVRFRIIAVVVGIGLIALVLVGMPLKYLADGALATTGDQIVGIVGPIHGTLYVLYLIAAFDLSQRCRWSWKATIGVLLAGTVPFLSFVAERLVTRRVRAGQSV